MLSCGDPDGALAFEAQVRYIRTNLSFLPWNCVGSAESQSWSHITLYLYGHLQTKQKVSLHFLHISAVYHTSEFITVVALLPGEQYERKQSAKNCRVYFLHVCKPL